MPAEVLMPAPACRYGYQLYHSALPIRFTHHDNDPLRFPSFDQPRHILQARLLAMLDARKRLSRHLSSSRIRARHERRTSRVEETTKGGGRRLVVDGW